jgi:hypothetical protein
MPAPLLLPPREHRGRESQSEGVGLIWAESDLGFHVVFGLEQKPVAFEAVTCLRESTQQLSAFWQCAAALIHATASKNISARRL